MGIVRKRLDAIVLASVSLVLAVSAGSAAAQDPPAQDETRLLGCLVGERLPSDPATAEQGGYGFDYQSLRGETDDARACTVYRARNGPDKPPTPFRWTLGDEIVVDKARLARCGTDADGCPWLTFVKYFAGDVDTNLSSLSYGLNADAYHEQVETYMTSFGVDDSTVAEAQAVLASSVGVELQGVFATSDDEPVALHLIVKSRFEPDPAGGTLLIYEAEDRSGSGMLADGRIRLAWDAATAVEPVATLLEAPDPDVDDGFRVALTAEAFELEESFVLHVFAAGDDEPLVSVEMPAYVPTVGR